MEGLNILRVLADFTWHLIGRYSKTKGSIIMGSFHSSPQEMRLDEKEQMRFMNMNAKFSTKNLVNFI